MTVRINRAPVLTLWAAVVAARMGYDWQAALSLGRAVAGLNAQAKGRRLGIFTAEEAKEIEGKAPKRVRRGEEFWVEVCGRPVPAKNTDQGVRAVSGAEPVDPKKADAYLQSKLGEHYEAVRQVMEELAASYHPEDLAAESYALYEAFRPEIEPGQRGWGQKGLLDLDAMRLLIRSAPRGPGG